MIDEMWESAALRNFIVVIRSRPGFKKPVQSTLVVKAHGIYKAKLAAIEQVARGNFKNRKLLTMWTFDKVEAIEGESDDKRDGKGA